MSRFNLTDLHLHGLLLWRSELLTLMKTGPVGLLTIAVELDAIEDDIEFIVNDIRMPADLAEVFKKVGIVL